MNVTYSPALSEQIKGRHNVSLDLGAKPVAIKSGGRFVERVDPKTRQVTGETQQFAFSDGKLKPLSRSEWVNNPTVIEVDSMSYR